nr:Rfp-BSD [Recombinant plasmid p6cys A-B-dk]
MMVGSLNCIVAVSQNMGIGKNGDLPWPPLRNEFRYFQRMTTTSSVEGKQNLVIMGKKTWFSIPEKNRPLKGRINLVLSRELKEPPQGAHFLSRSLDDALKLTEQPELANKVDMVWIVGGSSVYKEAMNHPGHLKLFVTRIMQDFESDTFFPEIDLEKYKLLPEYPGVLSDVQEEKGIKYKFEVYEKNMVSKGEEDNMAIIKEFMRFKVHMEGSVNGHEFEIEGEGEGRPYEGTQTAKLKVTKGGPLPFAWDILSPQFMYGSKAYVKHPADIPDYLKLSFPEGFKWERVMNFEDGGVVTVTQDSSLQDGEFIYKVKLRGTNFPSDGPVMQKKTMGWEASSERMYPEDGALKGEIKQRLKLKDGGHYDAEVKTTYKAKKPVQLPGAYNVNIKLDITSHNEDYTIVEQYERAEGRHSTGGMDELYKDPPVAT